MATSFLKVERPDVIGSYDPLVDVLHLLKGAAVPAEGDGLPNGVELTYSIETGVPCGVTVIGFKRNGWADKPQALAQIAADHLGLSSAALLNAIRSAAM